jgi:hypothetical protein
MTGTIGGRHGVVAQPLLPHPGEISATVIIVKTSPMRFREAAPILPHKRTQAHSLSPRRRTKTRTGCDAISLNGPECDEAESGRG